MTSKISSMQGVIDPGTSNDQTEPEQPIAGAHSQIHEQQWSGVDSDRRMLLQIAVSRSLDELDVVAAQVNALVSGSDLSIEDILLEKVRCRKGVKAYLQKHLPTTFPDKENCSPAVMAAALGMRELMHLLAKEENTLQINLLTGAIEGGQDALIDELLEDVYTPTSAANLFGYPVHSAARFGKIPLLRKLVANGLNVNYVNSFLYPPLVVAGKERRLDVIKVLQELGAVCVFEKGTEVYHIFDRANLPLLIDAVIEQLCTCPTVQPFLRSGRYLFNALSGGLRTFNFFVKKATDPASVCLTDGHNLITWYAAQGDPMPCRISALCQVMPIDTEDQNNLTALDILGRSGRELCLAEFTKKGASRISSNPKMAIETLKKVVKKGSLPMLTFFLGAAKTTYPSIPNSFYEIVCALSEKTPELVLELILKFLLENGIESILILEQLRFQQWYTPAKARVLVKCLLAHPIDPSGKAMLFARVLEWQLFDQFDHFSIDEVVDIKEDDVILRKPHGLPEGFSYREKSRSNHWRLLLATDFIRKEFGSFTGAKAALNACNPLEGGRKWKIPELSLLFEDVSQRAQYLFGALGFLSLGELYCNSAASQFLERATPVIGPVSHDLLWPKEIEKDLEHLPIEAIRGYLPKECKSDGIDAILDALTKREAVTGMPNYFSARDEFETWIDEFERDLSLVLGAISKRTREEQEKMAFEFNESGKECAIEWRGTLNFWAEHLFKVPQGDIVSSFFAKLSHLAQGGREEASLRVQSHFSQYTKAHAPNFCARVIHKQFQIPTLRSFHKDTSIAPRPEIAVKQAINAFTSVYNSEAIFALFDGLEESALRQWVIDQMPPSFIAPEIRELKGKLSENSQRDWLIKSDIFPRSKEGGREAAVRTITAKHLLAHGFAHFTDALVPTLPKSSAFLEKLKNEGTIVRGDESVAEAIARCGKARYLLDRIKIDPQGVITDYGHLLPASDLGENRAKRRAISADADAFIAFCEDIFAGDRRSILFDALALPVDFTPWKTLAVKAYLETLCEGKSCMTPTFQMIGEELRSKGILKSLDALESIFAFPNDDALLEEKTGLQPHPKETTAAFLERANRAAYGLYVTCEKTGKVEPWGKWNLLLAIKVVISNIYIHDN